MPYLNPAFCFSSRLPPNLLVDIFFGLSSRLPEVPLLPAVFAWPVGQRRLDPPGSKRLSPHRVVYTGHGLDALGGQSVATGVWREDVLIHMAVVVKTVLGSHFGFFGAPPILEPILVVGLNRMFTGGTIWLLTHGHMFLGRPSEGA